MRVYLYVPASFFVEGTAKTRRVLGEHKAAVQLLPTTIMAHGLLPGLSAGSGLIVQTCLIYSGTPRQHKNHNQGQLRCGF